jgi:hypothetical protein
VNFDSQTAFGASPETSPLLSVPWLVEVRLQLSASRPEAEAVPEIGRALLAMLDVFD